MTIRLPANLHDRLREESYTTRQSMNEIITGSLRWLDMDERARQYALLCHLFEAAWHHVIPGSLDDMVPMTSNEARKLSNLAEEAIGR